MEYELLLAPGETPEDLYERMARAVWEVMAGDRGGSEAGVEDYQPVYDAIHNYFQSVVRIEDNEPGRGGQRVALNTAGAAALEDELADAVVAGAPGLVADPADLELVRRDMASALRNAVEDSLWHEDDSRMIEEGAPDYGPFPREGDPYA